MFELSNDANCTGQVYSAAMQNLCGSTATKQDISMVVVLLSNIYLYKQGAPVYYNISLGIE